MGGGGWGEGGRPRSQSVQMARSLQGCYCRHGGQFKALQGAFTTSLGSRFQVLFVLGKRAVVGIYIGRQLVIGTITTSSIRRYCKLN